MASAVSICNLALSHVDSEGIIEDLDPTLGEEERVCSLFYDVLRKQLLTSHAWSFATEMVSLTLTTHTPLDTRWAYAYQYPGRCLKFNRIVNQADPDTKIPYIIMRDTTEIQLILTNEQNAIGEYIIDIEDPNEFDATFELALSWLIASHIATPLTGSSDKRQHALNMYAGLLPVAKIKDANEIEDQPEPQASWIDARL